MSADDMRVLTGFCFLIAYAAAAGTEALFRDSLKTTLPRAESERFLSEATEEAVKYVEQQDAKQRQDEKLQQDVKEEIHQRSAPRQSLLAEDYEEVKYGNEEKQVPQSYQFGFEVQDHKEGHQFRHEQKDAAGNVQGRFGYRDSKGQYRQVEYVADDFGFRANVKTNEAGVANEDPADVGIEKSQDWTLHGQVAASGASYPTGDVTIHKDDTNNKVNLQPPQTLVNDEPHSEETRYGLKHSPHPQHYLNPKANPPSSEPDEEYYYTKSNKPLRNKNASPAIVYRHFFKKHAPRRENLIPIRKYPTEFSDTTSNHRPYGSQSENFSPPPNQHQTNNEGYQHENEDYPYENEKNSQIVYQQYEQENHPDNEIDEIRGHFDENGGETEIKHEAPFLVEPEFYEIFKNSANDADFPYPNEKDKLILIQADKVKYGTDLPQQDKKQGVPYPGQTAIFIKHKNEEEPNYGERQYGFYKNRDFFNGNKQSNLLGSTNNNNKSPTPNQIRYGARYISRDMPPTQILQKAIHQPGTQLHYINKADVHSKPSYKPDSNKGAEIHIGAKPHNIKPYNEKVENYPKNLPLSVLQQHNTEGSNQNQEQFPLQQAILEIDADVYKQLIESKAPGQRIVAIPYNSQNYNYGDRASSIPVVLDKNAFPLKPHGILHFPIKHADVEHTHQQQNNMVPLEKLKRPAAIVLHIVDGQNIHFMSPKVPHKEDVSHGKDHVSYKLSQPHVDAFQKPEKEAVKSRDYSKSKWIPITPLWNQIRRQTKQDGASSASSAHNVQYISNLPRTDSSVYKISTTKSQNYSTPGKQRVF
ncbi:Adult-specific rigid cuticular protein 15.5, partial [Stegodyphus mimosarum]